MGTLKGCGCWDRRADRVSLQVLVSGRAADAGGEGAAVPAGGRRTKHGGAETEVPQMDRPRQRFRARCGTGTRRTAGL